MQAIESNSPATHINITPKSPTSPLKNRKTLVQIVEPNKPTASSKNAQNPALPSKNRKTLGDVIRAKRAKKQALNIGTLTFRPIKATFEYKGGIIENKPLFVKVRVGRHSAKSQNSEVGEDNPVWEDQLVLRAKDHRYATVKVKEYERYVINKEKLGEAKLDLFQIRPHGKTTEWVKLMKKGIKVGQLQIEVTFDPNGTL